MKIILAIGFLAAGLTTGSVNVDDRYRWELMAPVGSGSYPEHWTTGKIPMGLAPVIGIDENLWMVGQHRSWSSPDGSNWTGFSKRDWGERIGRTCFFFREKLWMVGGMMYHQPKTGFLNDIWNSADGKNWSKVSSMAEWQPRREPQVLVFKNKLWLFGGAIESEPNKAPRHFLNDVWSSEEGIKWSLITQSAAWSPRDSKHILVFRDSLWMVGSQGNTEIWKSDDGVSWIQVDRPPWSARYGYATAVFGDKIWVFGGQATVGNSAAMNDVWYTEDGIRWHQQTLLAPWAPRIPWSTITFKNRLWIFGGKGGVHQGNAEDTWTLTKE